MLIFLTKLRLGMLNVMLIKKKTCNVETIQLISEFAISFLMKWGVVEFSQWHWLRSNWFKTVVRASCHYYQTIWTLIYQVYNTNPADIYLFKVNNWISKGTRARSLVVVSFLSTLNRFKTLSWCFHCWL